MEYQRLKLDTVGLTIFESYKGNVLVQGKLIYSPLSYETNALKIILPLTIEYQVPCNQGDSLQLIVQTESNYFSEVRVHAQHPSS